MIELEATWTCDERGLERLGCRQKPLLKLMCHHCPAGHCVSHGTEAST